MEKLGEIEDKQEELREMINWNIKDGEIRGIKKIKKIEKQKEQKE